VEELETMGKGSKGWKMLKHRMECGQRMNNAVGWKGNETLGESKGNTEKIEEEDNVCKMYGKSECIAQ